MTTAQIHETLDGMLENPKTKNFLGHLVKNYFPTTNIKKVINRPSVPFKCVFTRENLASIEDVLKGIQTLESKEEFSSNLDQFLTESFGPETAMGKLLGDKRVGFTGKETTTYISFYGLQELYNWVIKKSLAGDKHINWLLGSLRNNLHGKPVEKPVERPAKPQLPKFVPATFSLGETDSFKKLKAKFNNEN